jgi:DNA-binding transcriptional ArsR family regulator
MVDLQSAHLDQVFQALSDPTRRGMLRALAMGERSVSDLAAPFAMTLAGASKHLHMLEAARLVRREKRGRTRYCRLELRTLAEADAWLAHYRRFWSERLDALEAQLTKDDNGPAERKKK